MALAYPRWGHRHFSPARVCYARCLSDNKLPSFSIPILEKLDSLAEEAAQEELPDVGGKATPEGCQVFMDHTKCSSWVRIGENGYKVSRAGFGKSWPGAVLVEKMDRLASAVAEASTNFVQIASPPPGWQELPSTAIRRPYPSDPFASWERSALEKVWGAGQISRDQLFLCGLVEPPAKANDSAWGYLSPISLDAEIERLKRYLYVDNIDAIVLRLPPVVAGTESMMEKALVDVVQFLEHQAKEGKIAAYGFASDQFVLKNYANQKSQPGVPLDWLVEVAQQTTSSPGNHHFNLVQYALNLKEPRVILEGIAAYAQTARLTRIAERPVDTFSKAGAPVRFSPCLQYHDPDDVASKFQDAANRAMYWEKKYEEFVQKSPHPKILVPSQEAMWTHILLANRDRLRTYYEWMYFDAQVLRPALVSQLKQMHLREDLRLWAQGYTQLIADVLEQFDRWMMFEAYQQQQKYIEKLDNICSLLKDQSSLCDRAMTVAKSFGADIILCEEGLSHSQQILSGGILSEEECRHIYQQFVAE